MWFSQGPPASDTNKTDHHSSSVESGDKQQPINQSFWIRMKVDVIINETATQQQQKSTDLHQHLTDVPMDTIIHDYFFLEHV